MFSLVVWAGSSGAFARPAKESVWVARKAGAVSCSAGSGRSVEEDTKELRRLGVHVLESRRGSDKKMHAQMCGVETGSTNEFRIPKSELSKALVAGYSPL